MSFSQGFNINNNSVYLSPQKIQEFSDKPIWNANQIQTIPVSTGTFLPGQTIVYSTLSGTGSFIPNLGPTGSVSFLGPIGNTGFYPISGGITGSVQYNNGNNEFTGDSNLIYSSTGLSVGVNQKYKANNEDILFVDFANNNLILGPSGAYNSGGTGGVFIGSFTGQNNSGSNNVFIGYQSGQNNSGDNNTLIGYQSGLNNSGFDNVFLGSQTGTGNKVDKNIFIGFASGGANTTGLNNIYIGSAAGNINSTGINNLGIGSNGSSTRNGISNVLIGRSTSSSATGISIENIHIGGFSGQLDNLGVSNTFIGFQSGRNNLTENNIYIGNRTGELNINGKNNTCIGFRAGRANLTSNNTCIGNNAGLNITNQSGVICIGIRSNNTAAGSSSILDDGLYFPSGLTTLSSTPVHYDNTTGQMGPQSSSLRFKDNVRDIEVDTTNIYNLRPVSYELKNTGETRFGLIAEEVNEYYPEIVAKDSQGSYSVDYNMLYIIILNEMKKLKQELSELI
jgi:hypothetical protein